MKKHQHQPFSAIALSARSRLAAALTAIGGLWLAVGWALDWPGLLQ